jgi:pyruvate dehydrogenase E2 component (dihydrolipoamide acetyltransferase)
MATTIIMPKQGQSVESCIITEWHKKKGDTVSIGDTLFAYETDKASFEEEATVEGTLLEILHNEGDEVPVLENVCIIGTEGEDISSLIAASNEANTSDEPATAPEPQKAAAPLAEAKPAPTTTSTPHKASGVSPRARAMAKKEAISLEGINGSGPKGRIITRDVEAALANRPAMTELAKKVAQTENMNTPVAGSGPGGTITSSDLTTSNPVYGADFEIKPLTNMRKLIAKAMHNSLQNSAQLTHHLGADARNLLALRQKVKAAMNEGYPTNITINDMVCYAVIKALKKFPQVNSHFLGDSMRLFSKVHLGLAVDTDRGLMVPAIKNADDLTVQGLSNQFKEVAGMCRKGNIDPELLAAEAASFTVSNLGNYGVELFTPVINLPQSAILGVNTIVPRPKDLGNGAYGFVPYMGLSLTYDHQALDGGEATRFLKQIAIEIESLEIQL